MHISAPNDDAQVYSQLSFERSGVPFEIAVVIDTDGRDLSRVRFAIPELRNPPGIWKLSTKFAAGMSENVADASLGQYDLAYPGCAPACEALELVRIQYLEVGGVIPDNTVLEVYGPGPDATAEPPVFYDCTGNELAAPMGGPSAAGASCVAVPAGALVLKHGCLLRTTPYDVETPYTDCGLPVHAGAESFGVLKARFH